MIHSANYTTNNTFAQPKPSPISQRGAACRCTPTTPRCIDTPTLTFMLATSCYCAGRHQAHTFVKHPAHTTITPIPSVTSGADSCLPRCFMRMIGTCTTTWYPCCGRCVQVNGTAPGRTHSTQWYPQHPHCSMPSMAMTTYIHDSLFRITLNILYLSTLSSMHKPTAGQPAGALHGPLVIFSMYT